MKNVTARRSNPFGFEPPCEPFVPGYGDANAHFHVVGDHPGVHGGADSGVPFTGSESGERLQRALETAGLLEEAGTPPAVDRTYFSYLYPCLPDGTPSDAEYADHSSLFDAELRAITAHVLLPVGERATVYVLENASARPTDDLDLDELHAAEIKGSGWLIVPIKEPAEWADDDESALVETLEELLARDYRQRADLGRFLPGDDPYIVR